MKALTFHTVQHNSTLCKLESALEKISNTKTHGIRLETALVACCRALDPNVNTARNLSYANSLRSDGDRGPCSDIATVVGGCKKLATV
jgi:hypothetical protein